MRRVPKLPNFFIAGHIVARNFPSVRKCKLGFRPAPLRLPPQLPIWLFCSRHDRLNRESVSAAGAQSNDVAPLRFAIGSKPSSGRIAFPAHRQAIGTLSLVTSSISRAAWLLRAEK